MPWLAGRRREPGWRDGPGTPIRFLFERDGVRAAAELPETSAPDDLSDLDPRDIADWNLDEIGRAWKGGLIAGLAHQFWDDLAVPEPQGEPGA